MKWKGTGTTLNGFLDRGSLFQGELTFEETFRIDGKFEGTIRSGSELILGDSAEVNAEIYVRRLSVNGSLRGSVDATEKVEVLSRARVTADLRTPVLKVEEGAFFQGRCHMDDRGKVVDLPTPAPPSPGDVKSLKTKKL
ncbi:MAG: polymer-forming cytoskeletal protein [Thermoanaerobaculia bacterium]